MEMEKCYITGIAIRTTNENGQAANDIPPLWNRFMSEAVMNQIPGKVSQDIYCVYTEYEKEFTKPYSVVLGCRVAKDSPVPDGFKSSTIDAGNYTLFTAKGKITDGIVYKTWLDIWNAPLKRKYTTDFEVYGAKAQDMNNAEVDIFVAVD